jgi:hypothetical protein
MPPPNLETLLKEFDRVFDTGYEDLANQSRGAFVVAFPLDRLKDIKLEEYVIGRRRPTFCDHLEQRTRPWANILGATAFKFGIYYGHTKTDPTQRYRYVKRAGTTPTEAFEWVKRNLVELVSAGDALDFEAIEKNPLSQMMKAKVLSLYLPDKFLNVCSREHIEALAHELGIDESMVTSAQQHLLLEAKLQSPITRDWSNPKFMTFLYNAYLREEPEYVRKVRPKKHRKVNIDEMLENRKRIGEMSEKFALRWEEERLRGLGFAQPRVTDCRDMPSCGYDFRSETRGAAKRCIEVKSAGKDRLNGGFRFFLSQTEYDVSRQPEFKDSYYFYLVFYDKDGKPAALEPRRGADVYETCDLGPNGFIVSFDEEEVI